MSGAVPVRWSEGIIPAARFARGSSPGLTTAIGQCWHFLGIAAPALSFGTSPARTTDDLPLPDGPITPRNRATCDFARHPRRRALINQPVKLSRPKKKRSSCGPKASRPRYGQIPSSCGGTADSGLVPLIPHTSLRKAHSLSSVSRNSTHDALMRNSKCATSPRRGRSVPGSSTGMTWNASSCVRRSMAT